MNFRKLSAETAGNRYLRRFLPASAGKFTCGTGYLQPSQVILHAPVSQCNLYLKKTIVIFFSDFDWHDFGFLGKILIFLGFLGKIDCQDFGKKFKIIQDYPKSWQENQDSKHWVTIWIRVVSTKMNRAIIWFLWLRGYELSVAWLALFPHISAIYKLCI